VEQALGRLEANGSLSVEELCSLIRSFEMTPPNADSAVPPSVLEPVAVDPAILERYLGNYSRDNGFGLFAVTRADDKLYLQLSGQPPVQFFPTSETEFSTERGEALIAFKQIEAGLARRLSLVQGDLTIEVDRIDAAATTRIEQALAERIRSGTARPGSEQTVRQFIEAVRSGTPNYEQMSPEFAQLMRKQLPRLHATAVWLGGIVAMEFRGVSNQGWDMYDIQREHGRIHHRIALGTDGKIHGAMAVLS
jgi:bla regulator protein BlaR1